MAIKLVLSYNNGMAAMTNEYICDSTADVINLPTDIFPSSKAYCVENKTTYILDLNNSWVVYATNTNNTSANGNIDLSNYYTKTETYNKTEANALVNNKLDKVNGQNVNRFLNETGTFTEATATLTIPANVRTQEVDLATFGHDMSENSADGNVYIGGLKLTDMPTDGYYINDDNTVSPVDLKNGEAKITRISGVLYIELYSADVEPHIWDAIYWEKQGGVMQTWRPRVSYIDYQKLLSRIEALENKQS